MLTNMVEISVVKSRVANSKSMGHRWNFFWENCVINESFWPSPNRIENDHVCWWSLTRYLWPIMQLWSDLRNIEGINSKYSSFLLLDGIAVRRQKVFTSSKQEKLLSCSSRSYIFDVIMPFEVFLIWDSKKVKEFSFFKNPPNSEVDGEFWVRKLRKVLALEAEVINRGSLGKDKGK